MADKPLLIFDLGDVLYPILSDREWLEQHLQPLLGKPVSWASLYALFDAFEVGTISEQELYEGLRGGASRSFTFDALEAAWNRRLIAMPAETAAMLLSLRKTCRVFLLSNTNQMHRRYFVQAVEDKFARPLFSEVFEHCFYSCDMGLKKPDTRIYAKVVDHIGVAAREQYLFFDDNTANVAAANAFGWRAEVVREPITAIITRLGLL